MGKCSQVGGFGFINELFRIQMNPEQFAIVGLLRSALFFYAAHGGCRSRTVECCAIAFGRIEYVAVVVDICYSVFVAVRCLSSVGHHNQIAVARAVSVHVKDSERREEVG